MLLKYLSFGFNVLSVGLMLVAGGIWVGAGVDTRPRYKDEQTLVGGAIWSQTIIPIGLLISKAAEETIHVFVRGYLLLSGVVVLFGTSIILCISEIKALGSRRHADSLNTQSVFTVAEGSPTGRATSVTIGILSFCAGCFTLGDFIILILQ